MIGHLQLAKTVVGLLLVCSFSFLSRLSVFSHHLTVKRFHFFWVAVTAVELVQRIVQTLIKLDFIVFVLLAFAVHANGQSYDLTHCYFAVRCLRFELTDSFAFLVSLRLEPGLLLCRCSSI